MFSSDVNNNQRYRRSVSFNSLSPTPNYHSSNNTDPSLAQALQGPLAAPAGWRSQVIHSNFSSSTNNLANDYEHCDTANTYDNTHYNQTSSNITHNNNRYIDTPYNENSFHQEQQQNNVIHSVGHQQQPPLIVRRQLPNNLVTYQQNVSVRYLKPPSPPPPGPLIIRKYKNYFDINFFSFY